MKKIKLIVTETHNSLHAGITTNDFHIVVEQIYLDWVNNYTTIGCFANAYGVSEEHAKALIAIGRSGNKWE